jgi:hypothetical protein
MILILGLLWDLIIAIKGRNYQAKMWSCLREKTFIKTFSLSTDPLCQQFWNDTGIETKYRNRLNAVPNLKIQLSGNEPNNKVFSEETKCIPLKIAEMSTRCRNQKQKLQKFNISFVVEILSFSRPVQDFVITSKSRITLILNGNVPLCNKSPEY